MTQPGIPALIDPMTFPVGYYAVADPDQPDVITCWRRAAHPRKKSYQTFRPWRKGVRYGPSAAVAKADLPADPGEREAFKMALAQASQDWGQRVLAAIAADLPGAQLLFASFATHCANCGRKLTVAESKLYAFGPDCRKALNAA